MKTQKLKYIIFTVIITVAVIAGITIVSNGNNSKFKAQLKLGNEALLNMDYEGAITAFANAIGLNPKDVEAYLGISKAYIALEDYSNAADYLSKGYYNVPAPTILGMLEPIEVKDLVSLGNEFLSKGESNLAEDAFEEALKKDPANEDAEKGKEDAVTNPNYNEDENSNINDNNSSNNNSNEDNNKPNKIKGNALSFVPSDITFMGYPVTENHYEEWKAALNFSGNDKDPTQIVDRDNEFCDELVCSLENTSNNSDYSIHLYDMGDYKSFLMWDQQGSLYVFVTNSTSNWSHIAKQYVSCPFYIGQTFDEALKAAGYTGEITFDNNPISISKDITVIGSTSDMNWVSFCFDGIGRVEFAGTNNVIEYILVLTYVK